MQIGLVGKLGKGLVEFLGRDVQADLAGAYRGTGGGRRRCLGTGVQRAAQAGQQGCGHKYLAQSLFVEVCAAWLFDVLDHCVFDPCPGFLYREWERIRSWSYYDDMPERILQWLCEIIFSGPTPQTADR